MQNLKIRVNNERERILIQELLFKLGYKWREYGTQINSNDYVKFIYAKTSKLIFHGENEYEFIPDPSKEVTIKDLKAMVEEKDITERGGEVKINIEAKPKHPKVWAWDDNVKEAFETYLIAEFDDIEGDLNYLVVFKNYIDDYENKNIFETVFYKNISYENPNTNPTVEAIAHRIKKEFEKHSDLDWAMIAAHKIYSSHIKLIK